MLRDKPLRIALVGVSGYARWYYEILRNGTRAGKWSLRAVTVINQAQEQACCDELHSMGVRVYPDFDTMLAAERGQIDWCCLPVGIVWHASMTTACLRAGMHVLVEKPVASSTAQIEDMLCARNQSGHQVFVGFQNMYADGLWKIKDILISGVLGRLKRIRILACWPRANSYYHRNDWAGKIMVDGMPVYDSPANNAMAHYIMMALFWAGSTRDGHARWTDIEANLYRAQRIESFDTVSARVALDGGSDLMVNMTHSSEEHIDAQIVVECERGRIDWSEADGSRVCIQDSTTPEITLPPFPETRDVMFQHIWETLNGDGAHVCTLDMAAAHSHFIQALHRAAEICEVDPAHVHDVCIDGEVYTRIEGAGEGLKRAHEEGELFSLNATQSAPAQPGAC